MQSLLSLLLTHFLCYSSSIMKKKSEPLSGTLEGSIFVGKAHKLLWHFLLLFSSSSSFSQWRQFLWEKIGKSMGNRLRLFFFSSFKLFFLFTRESFFIWLKTSLFDKLKWFDSYHWFHSFFHDFFGPFLINQN